MVLQIASGLEQVLQVPAPYCRVFATAELARLGPIQNFLDAAADAGCGLGRFSQIGPMNLMIAEVSTSATLSWPKALFARSSRRLPLRAVLGVAEARKMLAEIGVGALLERHEARDRRGGGIALCLYGGSAVHDWIAA